MWWIAAMMATTTTVGVAAGPDLSERAAAVDLPISKVTVFSDQARVERSAPMRFVAGPQVLRAPDLPGVVRLDTVRVTAEGKKVVRVETRPVERERWSIDQVDSWIAELETVRDAMDLEAGVLGAARQELGLLQNIVIAPPLPEKDRPGQKLTASPTSWMDAQNQLAARRTKARAAEQESEARLRALSERYQAAQREVQRRDIGGFSDQKVEVLIILDGPAKSGQLTVEYGVPGAFWKPAYDLHFDPDAATVALKASGLVTQATGEDWPDVQLALSTAIPGQGISVPQLATWTLGDDREYVPVPRARSNPRTAHPFSPPTPRPRLAEMQREADRELLETRTELLLSMADEPAPDADVVLSELVADGGFLGASDGVFMSAGSLGAVGAGKGGGGGGYGRGSGLAAPKKARAKMEARRDRAPPPPAPSMAMPMPMEAPMAESYDEPMADMAYAEEESDDGFFNGVADAVSSVTRSASGARRAGRATRHQGMRLASATLWRRPSFGDPLLPAMSAGGLDYVYDAPVKTSVPAEAQALRVPLAARSYPVDTFYEATPSLAETAYLKASVKNGSVLPILAGPANIFVKGSFAGDAQLATTGPGGNLELPLGADEDIRLTRSVVPATRSEGMFFGEKDVTDYTVTIEVGNYKKRPITIRVVDQLPRSSNEEVKIEMVSVSPKPEPSPTKQEDADGLLYWHVDVGAGAVTKVRFTYRITRPKGWKLHQ